MNYLHTECIKVNWPWGIEESIFFFNLGALWLQKVWTFVFLSPVFKKVTSAGLISLQQNRCKNSIWHFMILPKRYIFQKINIKLNSRSWMTWKSSVGIFLSLEHLQPQWPQWPRQPHFIKDFTYPDGWIIPGTQMTDTDPFLWNGSTKFHFSLIYNTISVKAVEASLCYFFKKQIEETQMSTPHEATRHGTLIWKKCWS